MRKLVKVWFDELHPMEGNHWGGTRGMTPGGAIFEEGHYYEANLEEKSLVLHHSCKVVEKKDSVELQFEDGLASTLRRDKVRRIAKVSRNVDVQPLHRKALTIFQFMVPEDNWRKVHDFVCRNVMLLCGDRSFATNVEVSAEGRKTQNIPCFGYHMLVATKNAAKFLELLFAEKLTPPGREWMVLHHHPTDPEAERTYGVLTLSYHPTGAR